MAQLQRPAWAYMNGKLVAWDNAALQIGCEAVTRGLNVFEGLKGYWQPDGTFKMVMLRQHYERLRRSARLLYIPCDFSYEHYLEAVEKLIAALVTPEKDMWARTTLFVTDGHWGEHTISDLVITAYHQEMKPPASMKIGVSTWRRSSDVALPARIKTSSNYQVARLARIEGRPLGYGDMVLLNQSGRVAESTAACLVMVRDGVIYTPPATEGALESITLDLVEALAQSLGIAFIRRAIDRTELLVADEIAMCGTLCEITLATHIENFALSEKSPILSAIQNRYLEAVRGLQPHPAVEMTALNSVRRRV